MTRLANLNTGDRFIWNGIRYTVTTQERGMTEVFGNNRHWAWPSRARVNYIRP